MKKILRTFPWWEVAKEKQKELRRKAEFKKEDEEKPLSIRDIPLITCLLVLFNTIIFIAFAFSNNYEDVILQWGFTPNNLAQPNSLPTLITYMFLHADILHIFFNMFIFFQFGFLCENKVGRFKFLELYFASGIFAALFHTFFNLGSEIPCVGASGAIFGALASYALLYPGRPIYIMLKYVPIKVPSIVGVFFVFLLETLYAFVGIKPYIAHTAHLGGGIAGVLMTAIFFPRKAGEILLALVDAMTPQVPEQAAEQESD